MGRDKMDLFERAVYRLPPKHRRRLLRLRSRLHQSWTPLELCRSLRILREVHQRQHHREPFPTARAALHLGCLLFRLPWHHPCHLPPPPGDIMTYAPGSYFKTHHAALLAERLLPLWRWRDTAPRAFFRLYEGFCAGDDVHVQYETEYFWYRNDPAWSPERLPDPRAFGELAAGDEGERQLAVLASVAEALAESFNWRWMHGFRRDREHVDWDGKAPRVYKPVFKGPAWAASVPRLPRLLELDKPDPEWIAKEEDNILRYSGAVCPFWKRNIFTDTGALRSA
ncbi:hypothetical protein RB596_009077 [Gaeumannomyces avenae]